MLGVEEHDGLRFIVVLPLGNEALQLLELVANGDEKPFSRDTVGTKGIWNHCGSTKGADVDRELFVSQEELLAVTIILKGAVVCIRMGESDPHANVASFYDAPKVGVENGQHSLLNHFDVDTYTGWCPVE